MGKTAKEREEKSLEKETQCTQLCWNFERLLRFLSKLSVAIKADKLFIECQVHFSYLGRTGCPNKFWTGI